MSTSLYNSNAVLNSPNHVIAAISSRYACNNRRLTMGLLGQAAQRNEIPLTIPDIGNLFSVSVRAVYHSIEFVESLPGRIPSLTSIPINCLDVNKIMIDKAIIALALDGHSTLEGIQRLLPVILGPKAKRSIGYISGVLNRAGAFAAEISRTIPLNGIKQGANDEIFDGFDTPVFTGIDAESTFIYLMLPMEDRTAESWQRAMEQLKELGLNLKVAISDAGSGLLSGIRKAFPDADIQIDVFHMLKDLGGEVWRFKKKMLKALRDYYDLESKVHGIKNQYTDRARRALSDWKKARQDIDAQLEAHDTVNCLYRWVHELLAFSGYTQQEVTELLEWLLEEMYGVVKSQNAWKLMAEIDRFKQRMPAMLLFLGRLFNEFNKAAQKLDVPLDAFKSLYRRLSTRKDSDEYWKLTFAAYDILGDDRFDEIEAAHDAIMLGIKRASSLVENVNSRLRIYMDVKRSLSKNFYSLVQLHMNTKKYRRSRVADRKGRSPVEILTGEEWPEILDLLEQRGFWNEGASIAA